MRQGVNEVAEGKERHDTTLRKLRKRMLRDEVENKRRLTWWQILLTWVCRIFAGGVFTFSGIAKAIDPWGTLYKSEEYLQALGFTLDPALIVTGVFLLFTLEFMTGMFLLTGSFRRSAPVMELLFMLGMLPLTLWIALTNPVADCGCFGDALHISNWETFWKNVALTAAGVWLLIYNRRTHWLVTPALQWVSFIATGLYAVLTGLVGYNAQPLVDFRPYKPGGPLVTATADDEAGEHFEFIYEKNGVQKTFKETDVLPDEADGWKFVDRREIQSDKPAAKGDERPLRIFDPDNDDADITAELSGKGSKQLILMMPDLRQIGVASTWKINSLKEWADAHNVDFFAVAAASKEEIDAWKDLSFAEYPVYSADDTDIKEAVRGNPGIIYTSDGNIQWKSTLSSLRGDDFLKENPTDDASAFYRDFRGRAEGVSLIYVSLMGVLVFLSFVPKVFNGFQSLRRHPLPAEETAATEEVSGDDTARREE